MAEAGIAAFGAVVGVAISLAIVCFVLRGILYGFLYTIYFIYVDNSALPNNTLKDLHQIRTLLYFLRSVSSGIS